MKESLSKYLIGEWISDPADSESIRKYGQVSMKFKDDGQLIYRIHSPGEANIMLLRYRVQGDWLITDQPSAPREERTAFSISPDGKLVLVYGDSTCNFIRSPISEISEGKGKAG